MTDRVGGSIAPLRLVFMGTADFAVPALEALVEAGHVIAAVYTQPPRPAGRGRRPRPSPVQDAADALGLPLRCPESLRSEREQDSFAGLGADAAVVAAYGLIVPPSMLAAPRLGCVNIHASLLPRWRGAAPIERAILAGDSVTGVTIMRMEEELDSGPILLEAQVPIRDDTTAGMLRDELAALGARLIVEALDGMAKGTLGPLPQPATGVTYARKVSPDEAQLDWRRTAVELDRVVRSFAPRPGAWFTAKGERVRVLAARPTPGSVGAPGTLLDTEGTVACGGGALRLLVMQRPGRTPMAADVCLRGFRLRPGDRLPLPDAAAKGT